MFDISLKVLIHTPFHRRVLVTSCATVCVVCSDRSTAQPAQAVHLAESGISILVYFIEFTALYKTATN